MLFICSREFIFVGISELVAKKTGKPFYIVKLADSETYINAEFFPKEKTDWDTLKVGQKVKCAVEAQGQYMNLIRMQ